MSERKLRCPNGHELKLAADADPIPRCTCGAEWLPVETGPTFAEVTLARPEALKKLLAYAGVALLVIVVLIVGALSGWQPPAPTNDHGKCNGSDGCDVCKNCSRCEHCSKGEGGTCGVCKNANK